MRLYITENRVSIPAHFYRNGRAELDILEAPALTRQAYAIDTDNSIKTDGFTAVSLPSKGLANILFGNTADTFSKKHKAVFEVSGNTYPVVIQVVKVTYNSYECLLSLTEDSWISGLKDMKLTEVDLGETTVLNKAVVGDNMALNFIYDEGQSPVLWSLGWNGRNIMRHLDNGAFARTGAYPKEDIFVTEDFRFWVSPLAFFRQAFCQIGYKFECPLLETEFGRRIWMYLLSENFYEQGLLRSTDRTYGGKLLNHKLESDEDISNGTGAPGSPIDSYYIPFKTVIFDESDGHDPDRQSYWKYRGDFSGLYKLKFTGTFHNGSATQGKEIFVVMALIWEGQEFLDTQRDPVVGDIVYHDTYGYAYVAGSFTTSEVSISHSSGAVLVPFSEVKVCFIYDEKKVLHTINPTEESALTFEWDTQLRPRTRVIMYMEGTSIYPDPTYTLADVTLLQAATLEGFVRGHHFYRGDKIKHQNCLRDDSVLEVLRGLIHTLNLHFEEKMQERTVVFYPSEDITVPSINGEVAVNGYYRDYQYSDERNNVVTDSVVMSTNSVSRYVKMGFKGVDAFNVPDDAKDNALSRVIDRGGNLNTDTEEMRNPYFFGTVDVIAPNTAGIFQDGIWLPNLATEEDTYTTSVQPRVAWAQWFGAQTRRALPFYFANNDYSDTAVFGWETDVFSVFNPDSLFAYLSNDPMAKASPVGTRGRAFTYGERASDLYERFWARRIKESYPVASIEAIMLWDRVKSLSFNFRNKVMLPYKGQPDIYKVLAVKDIDASRDLPALVSLTRGASVFNPIPCDCSVRTCRIYNFLNNNHLTQLENGVTLTFFETEGNEYVSTPVPLGDNVLVGGIAVNIITVLNSLNVPGFEFVLNPDPNPLGYNSIEITYPSCSRFMILFRDGSLDNILFAYTETGLYQYDQPKKEWGTTNMKPNMYCTDVKKQCDVC